MYTQPVIGLREMYFLFTATGVAGAERCPSNTDDFMRSTARRGVEKSSDPKRRSWEEVDILRRGVEAPDEIPDARSVSSA